MCCAAVPRQAKLKAVEEKIGTLQKQYEEATAKKEALAKQAGESAQHGVMVCCPFWVLSMTNVGRLARCSG